MSKAINVIRKTLCIAVILFVTTDAFSRTLANGKTWCTPDEAVCIQGSLTTDNGYSLLRYSGRLKSNSGPGELLIAITAHDADGDKHHLQLSSMIKGHYSEILKIDSEIIRGVDSDSTWHLDTVRFYPAK
jgi:hypothetical protein